jgi:hypothetical protein
MAGRKIRNANKIQPRITQITLIRQTADERKIAKTTATKCIYLPPASLEFLSSASWSQATVESSTMV